MSQFVFPVPQQHVAPQQVASQQQQIAQQLVASQLQAPQQQVVSQQQAHVAVAQQSQGDVAAAKFNALLSHVTGAHVQKWMDLKDFVAAVSVFAVCSKPVKSQELTKEGKEKWSFDLQFRQGTDLDGVRGTVTFVRDSKSMCERYIVGTRPFFTFDAHTVGYTLDAIFS